MTNSGKGFAKLVAALAITLVGPNAYSEGQASGFHVSAVRTDKNGFGYVRFVEPLTGTPASCANNHPNHLAFNLGTAGGKGIMSIALAAQATGKTMLARGTGTCDIYSGVESWHWGYVGD